LSFGCRSKNAKLELMGAIGAAIFDILTERCPRLNGGQELIRTPKIFRFFFKNSKL